MYVRDDIFELQMQFLKEYFHVLSFSELLNIWKERVWDKEKRYCVITFDDGWLDNYTNAYPILKKYNFPATIFLPTALIDTDKWFWPDKMSYMMHHYFNNSASKQEDSISLNKIDSAIQKYKESSDKEIEDIIEKMSRELNIKIPNERMLLNWKEIEEMSKHGISFGSHTCNHKILTKLSTTEIKKELKESLHTLEEKKINYVPAFCYPNGNYTHEISEQVKGAGYQAAVSTKFGYENGGSKDLFGLKRIGIHNDISSTMPLFAYRLSKES